MRILLGGDCRIGPAKPEFGGELPREVGYRIARTVDMGSDRFREIVDEIQRSEDGAHVDQTMELLSLSCSGQFDHCLQDMLKSGDERLIGKAVWIVSELVDISTELGDAAANFATHRDLVVRSDAINVLRRCSPLTPTMLSAILVMLDDEHHEIRRRAVDALARHSSQDLSQALSTMERSHHAAECLDGLAWFVSDSSATVDGVTAQLAKGAPSFRKFGVAAAVKLAAGDRGFGWNPPTGAAQWGPLRLAEGHSDPDVANYAKWMVDSFSRPQPPRRPSRS